MEINNQGLLQLAKVTEPLSIIGIVGPYHSGKSLLLNTLKNSTKGFLVGSKATPETMGIWLSISNMTTENGHRIAFLDTEGFFSNDRSESYDAKVFAIATFLSSHLIYNSVKTIDQMSVDYLEILTRRTSLLNIKASLSAEFDYTGSLAHELSSDLGGTQFIENVFFAQNENDANNPTVKKPPVNQQVACVLRHLPFPQLTWVIRDFAQDLGDGTATDYLKQFLDSTIRRDPGLEGLLSPLDLMYSRGLHAHTLFLPATDPVHLQDLSNVESYDLLNHLFRQQAEKLKSHIFDKLLPKRNPQSCLTGSVSSDPHKSPFMNGQMLSALLVFFIDSVNKDKSPPLPSQWDSWVLQLGETVHLDALQFFSSTVKFFIEENDVSSGISNQFVANNSPSHYYITQDIALHLPLSQQDFHEKLENQYQQSILLFKTLLFEIESLVNQNIETFYPLLNKTKASLIQQYVQVTHEFCSSAFQTIIEKKFKPLIPQQYPIQQSILESIQKSIDIDSITIIGELSQTYSFIDGWKDLVINFKSQISLLLKELSQRQDEATSRIFSQKLGDAIESLSILNPVKVLTWDELENLEKNALATGIKTFEDSIINLFDDWILSVSMYPVYKESLQKQIIQVVTTWKTENDEKLVLLLNSFISTSTQHYLESETSLSFPDEESILIEKCTKLADIQLRDFDNQYEQFAQLPIVIKKRAQLVSHLEDYKSAFLIRNLDTLQRQFAPVFLCALRSFRLQQCTWCLQGFSTIYTRRLATHSAHQCWSKHKDLLPRQISNQLLSSVIQHWISKDLNSDLELVDFKSKMAVFCLLMLIGSIIFIYICKPSVAQDHHRSIPMMPYSTTAYSTPSHSTPAYSTPPRRSYPSPYSTPRT